MMSPIPCWTGCTRRVYDGDRLRVLNFSYSRYSPMLIVLFTLIVICIASFPSSQSISREGNALLILGLIDATAIIILAVFGISPLLTCHTVTDNYILLRQGIYFVARIQLEDIERIEVWGGKAKGLGVSCEKENLRLYVVTRNEGLVRLVLKENRRLGLLFKNDVTDIVVNVNEPKRFVSLVSERASSDSVPKTRVSEIRL